MRMRVSELKAELDLRKQSYEGVMEKDELARMLADARSQGLADPDIVDSFNKANLENAYNPQPAVDPDAVAEAVASESVANFAAIFLEYNALCERSILKPIETASARAPSTELSRCGACTDTDMYMSPRRPAL